MEKGKEKENNSSLLILKLLTGKVSLLRILEQLMWNSK